MIETTPETDTAAAVLAAARADRAIADAAEARLLQHAVDWAAMHSVDSILEAETLAAGAYGEAGMPVAGEGAPWVAEFSVTEFAAALGMSTDAGKRYVGHALELRYRLPRVWKRVMNGGLRPWLARRIAEKTLLLTSDAAGFVDRHVAPTAHRIGPVQLDRLVDEAIGRHMPDEAEARRLERADGRYFTVESRQVNSFDGTLAVHGELDIADAMELESAIQTVAAQLKELGSEESLDVRRSMAVGELARRQLAFELSVVEEALEPVSNHHPRKIVLYVHLSQDALTARLEQGNHLITPGQLTKWCGDGEPGGRQTRPRPDDYDPSTVRRQRALPPTYAVAIRAHPPGADDDTVPALIAAAPDPADLGGATGTCPGSPASLPHRVPKARRLTLLAPQPPAVPATVPADRDPHRGRVKRGVAPQPTATTSRRRRRHGEPAATGRGTGSRTRTRQAGPRRARPR